MGCAVSASRLGSAATAALLSKSNACGGVDEKSCRLMILIARARTFRKKVPAPVILLEIEVDFGAAVDAAAVGVVFALCGGVRAEGL